MCKDKGIKIDPIDEQRYIDEVLNAPMDKNVIKRILSKEIPVTLNTPTNREDV